MALNMTKGLIPLPPHSNRFITKTDGVGMDLFAKKRPTYPTGVRHHRMQGGLWGTDTYFRLPQTGALTDMGLDHQTGELLVWIPYWDTHIVPWASGPVSQPYGDAACELAKEAPASGTGLSYANWGGVALELAGYFAQPGTAIQTDSPWSDISKRRFAQVLARIAHDQGIQHDKMPNKPDGCSILTWHIEWTKGTGKICPGVVMMNAADEVINLAAGIMKSAQTSGASAPPPEPSSGLAYPQGMNDEIAAEAFGSYTDKDGRVYKFDEAGPVSRMWLDLGIVTSGPGQPMQFPELDHVKRTKLANGDTQLYFFFSNGWIIYKPTTKAALAVIGGSPLDDQLRQNAAKAA